jgi:hypothetical protein
MLSILEGPNPFLLDSGTCRKIEVELLKKLAIQVPISRLHFGRTIYSLASQPGGSYLASLDVSTDRRHARLP